MTKPKLYHIRIQRWDRGPIEYLAWPITFPSYALARAHMQLCFTFKGITNRKASACVMRCK